MRRQRLPFKQPDPIRFTKSGLEEKQKEYEKLLSERPSAVADLKKAREMGDLSENGYYKSARFKLSDVDRRLRQLRYLLHYAVVTPEGEPGVAGVNTYVTVSDGEKETTYHIVGDYEANPSELKISTRSPIGKALVGKRSGDTVAFETQQAKKSLRILSVTS